MHKRFATLLLLLISTSVFSAPRQDSAAIAEAAKRFLQHETIGLPGTVDIQVSAVDSRLVLNECPHLQPFTPPGARLWGSTTVGVRCVGSAPWTIYLPVRVDVTASYLIATRALAQGQTVGEGDFVYKAGNLTQLPPGVLTTPAQAVGKVMGYSIASGEPLRHDMMRAPLIVQSNQPVKILSRGPGLVVMGEGRALYNASEGQAVQVRTLSGMVVAGIARPGPVVEITF